MVIVSWPQFLWWHFTLCTAHNCKASNAHNNTMAQSRFHSQSEWKWTKSLEHTTQQRASPMKLFSWLQCIRQPAHKNKHTRLADLYLGLPRWASTRKVKPIWILLKQETVSGSGISWAVCKSAPRYRWITMPPPDHSVFYKPSALPATQPHRQTTEGKTVALKAKVKLKKPIMALVAILL